MQHPSHAFRVVASKKTAELRLFHPQRLDIMFGADLKTLYAPEINDQMPERFRALLALIDDLEKYQRAAAKRAG